MPFEIVPAGTKIDFIGRRYLCAAISGAVLVSVFWFAKGEGFLQAQNHDAIWLIIFIVLAGVHGGRVMGVDARLAGRFRFLG